MNEKEYLKDVRFHSRNENGRLDIDAKQQEQITSHLDVTISYWLWSLPACYGLQSAGVILWWDEYLLPSSFVSAFPIFSFLSLVYLCMLAHRVFWIKRLREYERTFGYQRALFLDLEPNPPEFIKEDWRKTEKWFSKTNEDNIQWTMQLTWTPMIICPLFVAVTIGLLRTA